MVSVRFSFVTRTAWLMQPCPLLKCILPWSFQCAYGSPWLVLWPMCKPCSASLAVQHSSLSVSTHNSQNKVRIVPYILFLYYKHRSPLLAVSNTVSIVYKVTGCNDIPAIMIELAKIKIKSQKNTAKISLFTLLSAIPIYRLLWWASGSKPYQMHRKISYILIKSDDHKTIVLQI